MLHDMAPPSAATRMLGAREVPPIIVCFDEEAESGGSTKHACMGVDNDASAVGDVCVGRELRLAERGCRRWDGIDAGARVIKAALAALPTALRAVLFPRAGSGCSSVISGHAAAGLVCLSRAAVRELCPTVKHLGLARLRAAAA